MSVKSNVIGVAVQDILTQLRTPAVLQLATQGVRIFGDDLATPMVLVANQDNQGGPMTNLNGEELISSAFLNVLAVVEAGDLELATAIDDAVRPQLLRTAAYPVRENAKGRVYSITLAGHRSYVGPGLNGVGMYLYHGGYYRVRAEGRELSV
jgi:hypothetical protein